MMSEEERYNRAGIGIIVDKSKATKTLRYYRRPFPDDSLVYARNRPKNEYEMSRLEIKLRMMVHKIKWKVQEYFG